MTESIGIVARLDRWEALDLALKISKRFEQDGFRVFFEPDLAVQIRRRGLAKPLEEMCVDLIVTIGGDGTILRTCLRIPKPEPPLLAVDMGARGFLTEVPPERALEAVDQYLKGSYNIECHSKIASFIGDFRLPDALNEVFVTSRHLAKLLHVKVWKNDVEVAECRADGVIIASQVGSTAYSFSSGGPIIDPEVDALVLTPVCPVNLIRPIVFSSKSRITIEILKPKVASIVIDGDYMRNIGDGELKVNVRISEHKSRFVRFEQNFYRRLKARLLFSREEEEQL
ncbi:MAG: NAD(+)/NADH kinase [Candidatus Bathyarchaeia archaeon]